jgi:Ca2+-binding RTX toxin-like protein
MAWATFFKATKMDTPLFGDLENDLAFGRATIDFASAKTVGVKKGLVHTIFRGDLTSGGGEILDGTVRSIAQATSGVMSWTITGMPSPGVLDLLDRASHLDPVGDNGVNIGLHALIFSGSDRLVDESSGASLLNGHAGNDTMLGNAAADTLDGGTSSDAMYGGAGNDTYVVDNIFDTVNEIVDGVDSGGTDTVESFISYTLGLNLENLTLDGTGNITGKGNNGVNIITGNLGNNLIVGRGGSDKLNGMSGDDTVEGGLGNDLLNGAGGSDAATFYHSAQGVTVDLSVTGGQVTGAGNDTLTGIEDLIGSQYDDDLTGDDADNMLEGGRGDDTIDGGVGRDTASYAKAPGGVTIDLNNNLSPQDTTSAGMDRLVRIENVLGSNFADTITGSSASNVLDGGAGSDSLVGGGGVDNFHFSSQSGADTIGDFGDGADKLVFDADVFPLDEDGPGVVLPNEFLSGAGKTSAETAEQHFIYNTTTGDLYYDRDGTGFNYGSVLVAHVYSSGTTPAALSETDIIAG